MAAPTFPAEIQTDQIILLGQELVAGKRGLVQLKRANWIAGCLCEKYDGEELPALAMAGGPQSLEEIGHALIDFGNAGDAQAAISIPVLLGIILQIIRLIADFRNGGGDSGGPV